MSALLEASATRQLVVFGLAGEEYGIPITRVQEIIRYERPRPMPGSGSDVEGVINLRGRLIPVVGLRLRLGLEAETPESAKIVILEVGEAAVGFVVDDVHEVLNVDAAAGEPSSDGPPARAHPAVESCVVVGERVLLILDPDRLGRA